jgi:hypothetical protein
MAAPAEALALRSPTTTGAAQQVHIMPGTASPAPLKTLPAPVRPSHRRIHCDGSSACTAEPSNKPRTIACQIALP